MRPTRSGSITLVAGEPEMILRITSGKPRSALMWRAHRDGTLGGRVVEPDAFAESQNSEAGKGNSR